MFQIGWWTSWKCHLRLPVFRSTATRLSANRLLPGPVSAVEVGGRRLDRQVREAELLVDGHLIPDADVAVVRPRVLFPRVVAELAGSRNGVERPEPLARADVEGLHEALRVVVRPRRVAFAERGADDARRRCAIAGVACRPISPVIRSIGWPVPYTAPAFRSTAPSLPNDWHAHAGLRVERDEEEPGRDVEDPFLFAVGPVRHAASRQLARRGGAARAFGLAVHPPQLARRGVERDHRPPRARGRVEHAADHQRRAFELELGPVPEAVGLEAPGDFERVEVAGVDLRERRVVMVLSGRRDTRATPPSSRPARRCSAGSGIVTHQTPAARMAMSAGFERESASMTASLGRYFLDRSAFEAASSLSGATLSGSTRIIRYVMWSSIFVNQ